MTTQVDIANRALAQIGTRSQLTGSTINAAESAEALYASLLYAPLRDFLLAEGDYSGSMFITPAVPTTPSLTPYWPVTYEYPTAALRIRQLLPSVIDILNPKSLTWDIIVSGGVRKIVANQALSNILYTGVPTSEDLWDPIFTEAYTRLLASALAFALENRIEASKEKLSEALSFAGIANLRDQ